MSLSLMCWPHAHLFQHEAVLGSRALQVSEGESQQVAIRRPHADAVCTWSREEVCEALSGVLDPPRLIPGRRVERFHVQRDASVEVRFVMVLITSTGCHAPTGGSHPLIDFLSTGVTTVARPG